MMPPSAEWVKRSDGWVRVETAKTRGLNRCFNRPLEYVFKGAATTVITKLPGSPLQQRYAKLLEAGTKESIHEIPGPARAVEVPTEGIPNNFVPSAEA